MAEGSEKRNVDARRLALDKFLIHYLHGQNLERNFGRFLLRETEKPDFAQVIVASKREGTQTLQADDVTHQQHRRRTSSTGYWQTNWAIPRPVNGIDPASTIPSSD
jgi:hypothetical protein